MTPPPTLLIDSGTHGDEAEIIPFIQRALKKYRSQLPPYLYIREVSPSAVRRATRMNGEGFDLNRVFYDGSPSREVQSLIHLLTPHRFSLGVSFHMDLINDAFYLYDSGNFLGHPILEKFQSELEHHGVSLLSGVDDPDDSVLGDTYSRGYPVHPPSKMHPDDKTMWSWLLTHGVARRLLMPEIPGTMTMEQKAFIVDATFLHLIRPLSTL